MSDSPARVVLYLMGAKGLAALEAVVSSPSRPLVVGVLTARDSGVADDGAAAIAACASRAGIPCATAPQSLSFSADAWHIAIGWRRMIRDVPLGRLVVAHDSPLPRYRGFAPLVNMLIEGEAALAVTYFIATDGMYDDGDILVQTTISISYPITIAQAIARVCPLYADGLLAVLDLMKYPRPLQGRPQDVSKATYSMWLDDADYTIDLHWPASRIVRFIDAVGSPYRGALVRIGEETYRISAAHVDAQEMTIADRQRHVGKIIAVRSGVPVVVCGSGQLCITGLLRDRDAANALPLSSFRLRLVGRRQ